MALKSFCVITVDASERWKNVTMLIIVEIIVTRKAAFFLIVSVYPLQIFFLIEV